MARRVQFVDRLLDALATHREVVEALQRAPQVDEASGRQVGGLGLTPTQAEFAYRRALKLRGDAFREEQVVARSEQAHRIRATMSTAARKGKLDTVARLEGLYGRLFGTFAPTRVRVDGGDRRDAIARVLAGMTDEEIAAAADEPDGEEGDE